eukprot:3923011-Prymnesium_polylepis.5
MRAARAWLEAAACKRRAQVRRPDPRQRDPCSAMRRAALPPSRAEMPRRRLRYGRLAIATLPFPADTKCAPQKAMDLTFLEVVRELASQRIGEAHRIMLASQAPRLIGKLRRL